DDELRVALLARMRRLRLAIAEVAQIVLDSVGRVLEQVLVDRSLAFDRHELVAPIARQWIAGEDDADVRTRIDGERDVGDAVLVARAPDWRRRAVAVGDDAAQRADIDTGGARASGESDVSDRMDRAELVA